MPGCDAAAARAVTCCNEDTKKPALPSSAPPQAASSAGSMSAKRCGGSQPDRFAEVVASGQPTEPMSARASLLPGMRKAMVPSAER